MNFNMDAAHISINVYVALGVIVGVLGLVGLLASYIFQKSEKTMGDGLETIKKDLIALEARHDELSRTGILNEKSLRDSLHDIRTLLGTNYVTRTELRDAVEAVKSDMRSGFADLKEYIALVGGHKNG